MRIATLGIIIRGNWILLGRKSGKARIGGNLLNGPGGMQEEGESPIACMLREIEEEFSIASKEKWLEERAILFLYAGGILQMKVHVYAVLNFQGEPRDTESMRQVQWYLLQKKILKQMHPADRKWLIKFVTPREEKFDAKIFYRSPDKGFLNIEHFPFGSVIE